MQKAEAWSITYDRLIGKHGKQQQLLLNNTMLSVLHPSNNGWWVGNVSSKEISHIPGEEVPDVLDETLVVGDRCCLFAWVPGVLLQFLLSCVDEVWLESLRGESGEDDCFVANGDSLFSSALLFIYEVYLWGSLQKNNALQIKLTSSTLILLASIESKLHWPLKFSRAWC